MKRAMPVVVASAEALSSFIDGELDPQACRELWQRADAEQALATLEGYQLIREVFTGGLPDQYCSLRKVIQQALVNEPSPAPSYSVMRIVNSHVVTIKRLARYSLMFILGGLFTWLLMLLLGV